MRRDGHNLRAEEHALTDHARAAEVMAIVAAVMVLASRLLFWQRPGAAHRPRPSSPSRKAQARQ